jgi:hypothetical protein
MLLGKMLGKNMFTHSTRFLHRFRKCVVMCLMMCSSRFNRFWRTREKEKATRGGEWESIKILLENLTYISNRTRRTPLLTRPRPPRYSYRPSEQCQEPQRKYGTVLARPRARSIMKTGSRNNFCPHRHFTEQLVGAFRKSPRKSDFNHETSSFLIR